MGNVNEKDERWWCDEHEPRESLPTVLGTSDPKQLRQQLIHAGVLRPKVSQEDKKS